AIEMRESFSRLALERDVDEDHFVDTVVVPPIVRRLLKRPLRLPRIRVAREDRHRPFVVAGTLIGIPRSRISRAVVEQVQLRVVAVPAPRRAAAPFPLVALPGFFRSWESDFRLWSRAVHAPDLLAGVHIVRGDDPAHAEFAAADAGDYFVFDHERRRRDRLADSVVALLHLPQFLAGFGVEGNGRCVELVL